MFDPIIPSVYTAYREQEELRRQAKNLNLLGKLKPQQQFERYMQKELFKQTVGEYGQDIATITPFLYPKKPSERSFFEQREKRLRETYEGITKERIKEEFREDIFRVQRERMQKEKEERERQQREQEQQEKLRQEQEKIRRQQEQEQEKENQKRTVLTNAIKKNVERIKKLKKKKIKYVFAFYNIALKAFSVNETNEIDEITRTIKQNDKLVSKKFNLSFIPLQIGGNFIQPGNKLFIVYRFF